MSKLFKKVSALVLAGAITLSSNVSAFAADLNVYIRESNANTQTFTFPLGETPAFVIEDVKATDTIYAALTQGNLESGSLATDWSNYKYLENLTLKNDSGNVIYSGKQDGNYSDLVPDGNGGYSSGKWAGHSWMWAPATKLKELTYPDKTMDEVTCAEENYAIVLSYEYSSFSW